MRRLIRVYIRFSIVLGAAAAGCVMAVQAPQADLSRSGADPWAAASVAAVALNVAAPRVGVMR